MISPVLQNHHIHFSMQFSKTPLPSFYWYPQSYLQQGILVYVYISSLLSPRSALIISATCSTFHRHRTMYPFLVSLPFNILVSDSLLFCVVRSTETAELPQLFHHIRDDGCLAYDCLMFYAFYNSLLARIIYELISRMMESGEWRSSFNILCLSETNN